MSPRQLQQPRGRRRGRSCLRYPLILSILTTFCYSNCDVLFVVDPRQTLSSCLAWLLFLPHHQHHPLLHYNDIINPHASPLYIYYQYHNHRQRPRRLARRASHVCHIIITSQQYNSRRCCCFFFELRVVMH